MSTNNKERIAWFCGEAQVTLREIESMLYALDGENRLVGGIGIVSNAICELEVLKEMALED